MRTLNDATISIAPYMINQMPSTQASVASEIAGWNKTTRPATNPRIPMTIVHPRRGMSLTNTPTKKPMMPAITQKIPRINARVATVC